MSDKTTVPAIGRRERNKQQKLDRIVTAARALFYAQGYKKTTTQQIAHAAQVASGTLFLYAKTKEDLLLMVFHEEFIAIIDAISVREDDPRPVDQQVIALFDTLFDYHAHDIELSRELMRVFSFVSDLERREDVLEIHMALERKLRQTLENAQAKGVLSENVDALTIARALFGAYNQSLMGWLGSYIDRDQCNANLSSVIRGVLSLAYAKPEESEARRLAG